MAEPENLQTPVKVKDLISVYEKDKPQRPVPSSRAKSLGNVLSKNSALSANNGLESIQNLISNLEKQLNSYYNYNKNNHVLYQEQLFNILTRIVNEPNLEDEDFKCFLVNKTKELVRRLNSKLPQEATPNQTKYISFAEYSKGRSPEQTMEEHQKRKEGSSTNSNDLEKTNESEQSTSETAGLPVYKRTRVLKPTAEPQTPNLTRTKSHSTKDLRSPSSNDDSRPRNLNADDKCEAFIDISGLPVSKRIQYYEFKSENRPLSLEKTKSFSTDELSMPYDDGEMLVNDDVNGEESQKYDRREGRMQRSASVSYLKSLFEEKSKDNAQKSNDIAPAPRARQKNDSATYSIPYTERNLGTLRLQRTISGNYMYYRSLVQNGISSQSCEDLEKEIDGDSNEDPSEEEDSDKTLTDDDTIKQVDDDARQELEAEESILDNVDSTFNSDEEAEDSIIDNGNDGVDCTVNQDKLNKNTQEMCAANELKVEEIQIPSPSTVAIDDQVTKSLVLTENEDNNNNNDEKANQNTLMCANKAENTEKPSRTANKELKVEEFQLLSSSTVVTDEKSTKALVLTNSEDPNNNMSKDPNKSTECNNRIKSDQESSSCLDDVIKATDEGRIGKITEEFIMKEVTNYSPSNPAKKLEITKNEGHNNTPVKEEKSNEFSTPEANRQVFKIEEVDNLSSSCVVSYNKPSDSVIITNSEENDIPKSDKIAANEIFAVKEDNTKEETLVCKVLEGSSGTMVLSPEIRDSLD